MSNDPMDMGILSNPAFLHRILWNINPLTESHTFAPINRWPIVEPWDHPYLIALCHVHVEARCYINRVNSRALKRAMVVGEGLFPKIFQDKFNDQENARASLVLGMKQGLTDNIFTAIGDFNNELYQLFKKLPEVMEHFVVHDMPPDYPWTQDQIDNMNIDSAVFIMFFMALNLREGLRISTIDAVIMTYCALMNHSRLRIECMEIQKLVKEDLGILIILDHVAIEELHKSYLMNVNETDIQQLFVYLKKLIPEVASRLKLALMNFEMKYTGGCGEKSVGSERCYRL